MAKAYALIMIAVTVSFLGFVVENVWLGLTKGYMDNRNMMLPFLLGYGVAMLAIYLLFGTPQHLRICGVAISLQSKTSQLLVYFLLVMVCIYVGEILLGTVVEKTCQIQWWDYSRLPLHITRYTSIPTSAGFSVMVVTFMNKIFLPLYESFLNWDYKRLKYTAIILLVLLVGDYVYHTCLMYMRKSMISRWIIDTSGTRIYQMLHKKQHSFG